MESSTYSSMAKELAREYLAPIIAAGGAITTSARAFGIKNAAQCGISSPAISHIEGLMRGLRASRYMGPIVGLQTHAQRFCQTKLEKHTGLEGHSSRIASAALIGFISAPFLAAFNTQASGATFWEGFKGSFSKPRILVAITGLETSFLAALASTYPIKREMREHFGDQWWIGYASAVITGIAGGVFGQPFDNTAVRIQRGLSMTRTLEPIACPIKRMQERAITMSLGTDKRVMALVTFSLFYYGIYEGTRALLA